MVTQKRTLLAMSGTLGALAAALMLASGCAPVSYDTAGDSNPAPAANSVSESADPEASADPEESAAPKDDEEEDVKLTPEQVTEKLIAQNTEQMGDIVTNEEGFLLYRFDNDKNKPAISNCNGDCALVWPPAITDGDPELKGVDEDKVGTVLRADGTRQLTIDGWPLYTYIGDEKPGQWKGQKVGGVWFNVTSDGKKNLNCLPEGTPKAVPVPKKEESGKGGAAPQASASGASSDYDY